MQSNEERFENTAIQHSTAATHRPTRSRHQPSPTAHGFHPAPGPRLARRAPPAPSTTARPKESRSQTAAPAQTTRRSTARRHKASQPAGARALVTAHQAGGRAGGRVSPPHPTPRGRAMDRRREVGRGEKNWSGCDPRSNAISAARFGVRCRWCGADGRGAAWREVVCALGPVAEEGWAGAR